MRAWAIAIGVSVGALRRTSEVRQLELTDAAPGPHPRPRTLPALERLDRFLKARSTAVGNQLGVLGLGLSEQDLLALPKSSSARLAACVQKTRVVVLGCVREGQEAEELR